MRISPINSCNQNYSNSFKSTKPTKSLVSKVAQKALLPTAICAYIFAPLLKAQETNKENFNHIQYEKTFVMDSDRYTMEFVNTDENFGENAVTDIYFTPQDTTKSVLKLDNITKYVSDNHDNYHVDVKVTDISTGQVNTIDLPEEIGDELLNLYDGETDLFVIPGLNYYTELNAD